MNYKQILEKCVQLKNTKQNLVINDKKRELTVILKNSTSEIFLGKFS